jgi:hypothetical protein
MEEWDKQWVIKSVSGRYLQVESGIFRNKHHWVDDIQDASILRLHFMYRADEDVRTVMKRHRAYASRVEVNVVERQTVERKAVVCATTATPEPKKCNLKALG